MAWTYCTDWTQLVSSSALLVQRSTPSTCWWWWYPCTWWTPSYRWTHVLCEINNLSYTCQQVLPHLPSPQLLSGWKRKPSVIPWILWSNCGHALRLSLVSVLWQAKQECFVCDDVSIVAKGDASISWNNQFAFPIIEAPIDLISHCCSMPLRCILCK